MFRRKRRTSPVDSFALEFSAFTALAVLLIFTSMAQAQTLNPDQPLTAPITPLQSPTKADDPLNHILPYKNEQPFLEATPTMVRQITPDPTWAGDTPTPVPTATPPPTFTPVPPTLTPVPRPGGLYGPLGPATIKRQVFIDWVYEYPMSAAKADAGLMYDALVETQTDPAIFAGFALHESTVASAGSSVPNRNIVNISCLYSPCAGRWQIFPSFAAGTKAWGQLMHKYADGSICGKPKVTLDEVLYCYAPSFENPTSSYIWQVKNLADRLRNK